MSRAEETRDLLRMTFAEPTDDSDLSRMDKRILSDASTTMKQAVAANRRLEPASVWRRIMRTKTVKLATAAAVVVAAFVLTTLDRSAGTAWSVEQTIAAIERLRTVQVRGTAIWGPTTGGEVVNFNFWIQPPEGESPLKMRFECEKRIIVVQGNAAYECWPDEKVARIKHGPDIADLKYWYEAAELTPWLTGEMLETLRLFSDDWNQTTQKDADSGKEQIVVTCSYLPGNTSFLIVVDPKSKLIQRIKLWHNLQREGKPDMDAQTFIYNQGVPRGLFELPEGMTVVNESQVDESEALFDKGESLFHNEQKYAEAITVYRQVYEKFPDLNIAETALMMVGLCHRRLGQHDEEIKAYEKAVSEYPNLKGWIESTYFYLGRAYMDIGEQEKALDAFEKCLAAGQGVRKPEQFPLKEARECIAEIKAAQDHRPSP
jgi:tetratricopeptide (TPR) repeat protein